MFPGPPEVWQQVFARFGPTRFPAHYLWLAVRCPMLRPVRTTKELGLFQWFWDVGRWINDLDSDVPYESNLKHITEYRAILRLLWLIAVGVVVLFSLLPSSSPALQAVDALQVNDKVEHLCAYAGLAFLPVLHERWRTFLLIALALIGMGIGLEFGQLLSDGRQFEVADMVADGYGVLAGLLAGLPPRVWIRRRSRLV